ncbi:hypothetical protein J7M07_04555, partial [bacterium]|nr:hypothetical protein [bacterium]
MKRISISSLLTTTMVVLLLSQPVSGVESGKNSRNYDFNFHGYFKTDMSYDNAQIYPGDFHLYVPAYNEADNALYFGTKESRMGFDFLWKEESFKTKATFEFDLFGAGAASVNKATPMLRHAYFKITGKKWSLLAGQTWDVISPLVPKTVNYSVAWGEGNIGYRRPQIRLSTWADVSKNAKFNLDLAVTRNMGGDFSVTNDTTNVLKVVAGDGVNNGADAAMPAVQGHIGITTKCAKEGTLSLGVSGHYGQEKYNKIDSTSAGNGSV